MEINWILINIDFTVKRFCCEYYFIYIGGHSKKVLVLVFLTLTLQIRDSDGIYYWHINEINSLNIYFDSFSFAFVH